MACAADADVVVVVEAVVILVSSETILAAEGVEGVTGNGIAKVWVICAEIDDRIWITLVGIIVGAAAGCAVVACDPLLPTASVPTVEATVVVGDTEEDAGTSTA